jgi:tetratricopeptide (TPR) repeat protein
MRYFRFCPLILCVALSALPAFGQSVVPQTTLPNPPINAAPQSTPAAPQPSPATAKPVDPLFEALKRERNPERARGIATQIMADLNDSGSATVDLLMQWAATAIKEKRNAAALDFLDQVTVLDPAYPEGWNRRATLHYTMGNTRKSMADIAEVLKREPRHFGALAGMAGILMQSGKDELALKAWQDYLTIYPADRDAQEAVSKLSEKIAGNRT